MVACLCLTLWQTPASMWCSGCAAWCSRENARISQLISAPSSPLLLNALITERTYSAQNAHLCSQQAACAAAVAVVPNMCILALNVQLVHPDCFFNHLHLLEKSHTAHMHLHLHISNSLPSQVWKIGFGFVLGYELNKGLTAQCQLY